MNDNTETGYKNSLLWPLLLVVSLIPLIVHEVTIKTHLSSYDWFTQKDEATDLFLFCKSWGFVILAGIMLGGLFYITIIKKKKLLMNPIFYPAIVYAICTLLSAIVSENRFFSFYGVFSQYETVWVLMGYIIVLIYSYQVIETRQDIERVIKWLVISASIICIIGFTQLLKSDFFTSSLGKALIGSNKVTIVKEAGRVYSTLFNENYVGLYCSLIVPIVLMLVFFSKSRKKKIGYGVLLFALLACVIGAQAKNGMVAIAISVVFLFVFLRKYLMKRIKILLVGVVGIIVLFIAINFSMNNAIVNNIKNVFVSDENYTPSLTRVTTKDDRVEMVYNGELLQMQMNIIDGSSCSFVVSDSSGTSLITTVTENGEYMEILDERFSGIKLTADIYGEYIVCTINVDNKDWMFTNQTDGTYYYCTQYGKLLRLDQTSSYQASWRIASYRGYIWDKTLSIIKEYPLLGIGPDNFLLHFPNTDYLDLNNSNFYNESISKPHNMYLQITAQTGIISLIAFLLIYLIYFISSLKIYIKADLSIYEVQIGLGIFVGTVGYMISGLVNDSTITVSPVYWVLLGTGVVINKLINKKITLDVSK